MQPYKYWNDILMYWKEKHEKIILYSLKCLSKEKQNKFSGI